MLTQIQADMIVAYIEAVENCKGHHPHVVEQLTENGFTVEDVDAALQALGKIAGRDCGIL